MRIALLSDIHGNLLALDQVLSAIQNESVDRIVCLGDVVANGPQPHQVIERLRPLNCPIVMGNTDEWFLVPQSYDPNSEKERRLMEMLEWGTGQLSSADLDWIRTFQPSVQLHLADSQTLLCFHGSPRSSSEVIFATTPDEELMRMLETARATVMAGGHTHVQMLRRCGDLTIINPGSVGMPIERGMEGAGDRRPPRAEYALVTAHANQLSVEFRRVPINLDELRRVVRASGMPHAGAWLKDWR